MAVTEKDIQESKRVYKEKYGFADPDQAIYKAPKGFDPERVIEISSMKNEPDWMLKFRLKSLEIFNKKPMPAWGANLSTIPFDDLSYFVRTTEKQGQTWEDVPEYIKDTFEKLGIPEAERKFLAGVSAQYESEVVYHSIQKDLEAKGVIFLSTEEGLEQHPELFRQYFGTVIPSADNKFAAMNGAFWSGGSFVYVPPGVQVTIPLQAYFRINSEQMGQFERTLIIVDEGAYVHYVEGCTAPVYSTDSFHSGVIEIIVKKNARCRYTTIQNWSTNVYNLVTQRSAVYEGGVMEWVDANLGSNITMKYPSVYLMEPGAKGDILSIAYAGEGQVLDAGGKAIHVAPNTSSKIISKSISQHGGRTSFRGLLKIYKGAEGSKSAMRCDALILDSASRSDTYPTIEIEEEQVSLGHEAVVSRIGEDQLFYLMSRGLGESEAAGMIVSGFIEPIVKELPMEYAVEMNRLIQLQMDKAVG
jgi:Fe-S cluster assembly protein SufB